MDDLQLTLPLHPSLSSSVHPSPLALLIPNMHNTDSPGQPWTGGWSGRPDLETKHYSLPFEYPTMPLGLLFSRESALCWDGLLISC